MDLRRRLSRLFGSVWARFVGLYFGILVLMVAIVAAYTGDLYLAEVLVLVMISMLLRLLLIAVVFFWPIWIAIIMVWTGYWVLFKKRSEKRATEPRQTKSGQLESSVKRQLVRRSYPRPLRSRQNRAAFPVYGSEERRVGK